ncbi:MAG: RNA polymerase sigma factor [Pseudonocardiaceae bacterium]
MADLLLRAWDEDSPIWKEIVREFGEFGSVAVQSLGLQGGDVFDDNDQPASGTVADLLLRARRGDSAAWEEIVRRYSSVVFATVRSFRLQDADVLDAVQMTWLRLAENSHRVQFPERLAGWLATTARRECMHILRQQAKHAPAKAETVAESVVDQGAMALS